MPICIPSRLARAKEKYIARLKKEDADTRLVSAADKLNNVRSIVSDYRALGESVWSRFNGGRDGTLWYYRTLRDEFLRQDRTVSRSISILRSGNSKSWLTGMQSPSTPVARGMKLWRA